MAAPYVLIVVKIKPRNKRCKQQFVKGSCNGNQLSSSHVCGYMVQQLSR